MTYQVPLWVRALLAVDRAGIRAQNVREALRDEILLACIPPSERASLTAALYADQSTYLPGGHRFQSGLFAWERRALDSKHFPRSGRVLIGASGAGREALALLERGFDVVAFDPCDAFVDAARRVAPRASIVRASYDDLIDAASPSARLSNPLAPFITAPFDAIILGWGSLSHVTPFASRVALFRALRALAPRAPVLASFALAPDTSAPRASKGRVRDALRRAFAALGSPAPSEPGDHFLPDVGFFSLLARDEPHAIARESAYKLALFEDAPYPHAVFEPASPAPP